MKYLSTWFLVDFTSVIPFELIASTIGGANRMARFSRIGKIYKLIRMLKLMRLVRIVKVKQKGVKHLGDILKISAGTERVIYILLTFSILQHVTACIWIFIGRVDDNSRSNWIYHHGFIDSSEYSLYVSSLYFTVTTL
jgi:hypothetical protein